jgi:hypothetical protein
MNIMFCCDVQLWGNLPLRFTAAIHPVNVSLLWQFMRAFGQEWRASLAVSCSAVVLAQWNLTPERAMQVVRGDEFNHNNRTVTAS